jgi:hypothetical protein
MTTARAALTLAAFVSTLLLMPWTAWAYRPFISTDAAVADQRDLEIELGYFTLEQSKGENTFRIPSLTLNYGAWKNTEIVGEFRIERNPRGDIDVVDPGVSLKTVLREGLLQEKPGVSVAIEAGPLLPSTVAGERGVGFEAIGILSGQVAPLTLHLNGGGGIARAAAQPFGVWGLISELPVLPRFRIVGEVAGESVTGQRPNNSALIGFIWQPSPANVFFDAGVRRGLTRGAPDWLFTVGVTFGFTVPFGPRESPR